MEQAAIGELLMIKRIEQEVTRRCKMFFDRLSLTYLAQHWQKMNAVPNKAGILKERLPGRGDSDDHLLLACQAMQQKLKTRQKRDVQSAT